jgi:hypothetical protein
MDEKPDLLLPHRYRKRPILIEAMPLTIDNLGAVVDWVGKHLEDGDPVANLQLFDGDPRLWVSANQAWVMVEIGNEYIARDELGFYPIKRRTFENSYDLVEEVE